jgi:ABC-type antimicrobial peptide transport system permease subunit
MVVRAADGGDPALLLGPVRATLAELDPQVAPAQAEPMTAVASRAIARQRLVAMLLSTFGLLAAALATVGIYGVLSYAVNRRTREIGIRMALGARGPQVVGLMARQGLGAAAVGIGLGAAAALLGSGLVSGLLFAVGPRDPFVLGVSATALGAVALAAALLPARRAARVHPMETLRAE